MFAQGHYQGRVTDCGLYESTNNGNPTFHLRFELLGVIDPVTGEFRPCAGETRSFYRSINEKTFGWLFADLRAVGIEPTSLSQLDPESPSALDLFGREIAVSCEIETYQGQPRERWSLGHRTPRRRLDAESLAALDARFADRLRATEITPEAPIAAPAPDGQPTCS